MKHFFGLFILLGLFTGSLSLASTSDTCKTYVIIVSPNRIPSQNDLDVAFNLLSTPGLTILHQNSYFGNGKMYLMGIQNTKDANVVQALDAIEGVVVSCETYYKLAPRMTGTN